MGDTCAHNHHLLRTLSRPEPPPELHARIAAAICGEAARRQHRRRRRCAFSGVTALLSFVVVVHDFLR